MNFNFLKKEFCTNLHILLIENKPDDLFPSAQFLFGRSSNGNGILLFIRDDIHSRLLSNLNKTESIFAEINFRKKKDYSVHSTILIKVTSQTICTIWEKV